MGCNQSRKETSFSADELKKLKEFHQKTANSYPETKGKDDLSVQAFRDIFAENILFGEKLHSFMLKLSTTQRIDVETFVDVLELLIRKASNKKLSETFASQDKVGLICMVLFPHLRKTLQTQQNNKNSLISYSEAFDFTLCVLRMFNAQPDQKINEATAKSITDRIYPTNETKIEFWSFGMLIKDQINLIGSLIHIYLKGKFLDGTVSFLMPKMPDLDKQILVGKDQLTTLYLNNQYLLNACELRLLYQGNQSNYNFEKLVADTQAFTGQTFILLQFQDSAGLTYTVGGFNPAKWQGNNLQETGESYVFSLSPKYKHYFPVVDAYGQRTVLRQQFVLNTEGGYGREVGIAFGASKDDSRIWLDGKQLQNTTVSNNNDKFFKKGALIPANAPNPVCTLVEVYGVRTDLSKKNFSYSAVNVNQLSSILTQSKDIRQSLTGGTYDSQSYAFRSTQRTNTAADDYSEEIVKRSAKQRVVAATPSSSASYQVPSYQPSTYSSTVQPAYVYTSPVQSSTQYSPSIQPTNSSYLYATAQPVTTTTTYNYDLSNSSDPTSEQQKKLAVEALSKKYDAIIKGNNENGIAPRSTLPAEYSYNYQYQSTPSDVSANRNSSIPTYQAYNFSSSQPQYSQ